MDFSIIYQNQNVYIVHFDSLSSSYDKEVYGTLLLTEKRNNVNGRITIERFIVWKPSSADDIPKGVRNIKIDIDNIKSIKRSKMTIGNCYSYMIFYEREGTHHPMLVFPDGGTRNLMEKLENFISLKKSSNDKNFFLVETKKDQGILESFENWSSFLNETSHIANNRMRNQVSNQLWSGLVYLGANITNQIQKNVVTNDDRAIRNLLREDALSLEYNGLKMDTKSDGDSGFTIVSKPLKINLPPASPVQRREPLSEEEWKKHIAPNGSVTCVEKLKEKIFKGGITKSLRKTVWKYLLGYYRWEWTDDEITGETIYRRELYDKLITQWENIFPEQEERFTAFQDRKSIIERDVLRTDRMLDFYSSDDGNIQLVRRILMSYSMYNFNLGYVQGMNDLLAPVLYTMHDELDSFWCFVHLMNIMESNFTFDQSGIKKQFLQLHCLLQLFDPVFADYLEHKGCHDMLFCFRFLLVNFKRELSYENTMYLWEVLWTNYRCWNFHLLFTLAVLLQQRNQIIENRYGLNEILKHVNDIELNQDLEALLCRAESLYLQLEQIWPQVPAEMKTVLDFRGSGSSRNSNSRMSRSSLVPLVPVNIAAAAHVTSNTLPPPPYSPVDINGVDNNTGAEINNTYNNDITVSLPLPPSETPPPSLPHQHCLPDYA